MKKRPLQITFLLLTAGLLLSSSLNAVTAQTSNTNPTQPDGNSGPLLKINIFVNNTLDSTFSFSFNDIVSMPKTTVYAELSCYGRFIKSGQWGGVSLGNLLEQIGFSGQSADLDFLASDGYRVPFAFSDATPKDVIIAYELDGSPLPEVLRLVIPNANGESWISMITSISINNAIYPISPNPAAASIVYEKPLLQQSHTPQPSPTPKPKDPPITQPTVPTPTPTNQPAQQIDNSSSSLQLEPNVYLILIGIIVAAATVAVGFLLFKRSK